MDHLQQLISEAFASYGGAIPYAILLRMWFVVEQLRRSWPKLEARVTALEMNFQRRKKANVE